MRLNELKITTFDKDLSKFDDKDVLSWKWHEKTPKSFRATFTVDKNDEVEVKFTHRDTDDNDWEVEFSRTSPFSDKHTVTATGTGHAFEIFSTFTYILIKFVQEVKPASLMIWALERNDKDSRTKLYDRLMKKLPKKHGYSLSDRVDFGGSVVWVLKRDSSEDETVGNTAN